MINRQRDSIDLLSAYQGVIPNSRTHVVRNSYFGSESKFQLYDTSKARREIEQAGGKSVTFPDMADRVADELYSRRMTIADASTQLPIGNRAELLRWRNLAHTMMTEVLGG